MTAHKPCTCWVCSSLHPKVTKFEEKLNPEMLKEFRILWNELWNKYEVDSTDLSVLHSKIEGIWPREEGDKYYDRIGNVLYELSSTPCQPLEVKPPVGMEFECNHDFRRGDGGTCKKCGYTVVEINNL